MDIELTNEIKQLKLIAALYGRQGKLQLAEKTYQQLLVLERREHGEFSNEVAAGVYDLAEILRRQNHDVMAIRRYEEAISIWERLQRLDLLTQADRSCYLNACAVLEQYRTAQHHVGLPADCGVRSDVIA